MIKELLKKRDLLADIAATLYGESWVTNETFWNSPTEREMAENEEMLANLGWRPEISPEAEKAAERILKMLVNKGVIDPNNGNTLK